MIAKYIVYITVLSSLVCIGWCSSSSVMDVPVLEKEAIGIEDIADWVKACFNQECFELEIADDEQERRDWLMYRKELDTWSGMLFVRDSMAVWRLFWMKNTLIPLDIIWLDDTYSVVHIETDVPPCTTPQCPTYGNPEVVSQYVVELSAGQIQRVWIEIWDIMRLQ